MSNADRTCTFDGCTNRRHGAKYCTGHERQLWLGRELTPLRPHRRVKNGRKECSRCGEVKPVAEFHRKGKYVQEICLRCRTINHRVRTYGLSWGEAALLADGAECEACGEFVTGKQLHVDHCHGSGAVRGVLCNNCNRALGLVDDDPDRLRKLADYLESHRAVLA